MVDKSPSGLAPFRMATPARQSRQRGLLSWFSPGSGDDDDSSKRENRLAEEAAAARTRDEALTQRESACVKMEADAEARQQQLAKELAAAQQQAKALAQQETACKRVEDDLQVKQQQAAEQAASMQAQEDALVQRELVCDTKFAELAQSQERSMQRQQTLELQQRELYTRAAEVQARHEQLERVRVAAMQDVCAHCVGLVLHNTKTSLRTASEGIAEHCDVLPNQVVEATPGSKYPLLALLTPGSGRVTELDGITVETVQAWREQFLAPGGALLLALLRSGRDPTGTSKGALGLLQDRGICVDVLLDFCLDSSSAKRPFHAPTVSTMNHASFAQLKKHMPPPPPPPPEFGSLFSFELCDTDGLSVT